MKHLTRNKVHIYYKTLSGEAKEKSKECLAEALALFLSQMGEKDKKIVKDEKGKPHFLDFPPFHLSLTHTGSFFAAVFAPFPVGVDAEWEGEVRERVAERYFSPREKKEKFSRIWCAKEAVGKLTGLGLSDALRCRVEPDFAILDKKRYSLFYESFGKTLICVAIKE